MKYRAALASFDGQYVDEHFGHAQKYYIYEFDSEDNSCGFVEKRFVDARCECSLGIEDAFDGVLGKLGDVGALIISRIGKGATELVESRGYVIYESVSAINDVLESIKKNRLYEEDKWREISMN